MIIKLDEEKAIWFGYSVGASEKNDIQEMSFEEGVFLMMEKGGYSREQVAKRFRQPGGDVLLTRMANTDAAPQTIKGFIDAVRSYFKAFKKRDFSHPDKCMVINHNGLYRDWTDEFTAKSVAKFCYNYLASK